MTPIFAAFVVCKIGNSFAATTRTCGKIGLPGGKVDSGELPADCAVREAKEEGWNVRLISSIPIHCQIVDGKPVQWFAGEIISKLDNYKEKHRGIIPILISKDQLLATGFGNENLPI
jgi:hypothetical protein